MFDGESCQIGVAAVLEVHELDNRAVKREGAILRLGHDGGGDFLEGPHVLCFRASCNYLAHVVGVKGEENSQVSLFQGSKEMLKVEEE